MFTAIMSLIGSVLPGILSRVLPGDSEDVKKIKLQIEGELQKALTDINLEQLKINKEEAGNSNRTWPTWRECLGFVCVTAVAYHFVIQQFLSFIMGAFGSQAPLPELEMSGLMTILSTMLGVHYVDSRFNSPPGIQPSDRTPKAPTGKLVNGIWADDQTK